MEDDADVIAWAPLDGALIELLKADRDNDADRVRAAITAVAWAWVQLDDRAQMNMLRYFHADKPLGAALRSALTVASEKYDLGMASSNYAAMKGRPWTT